MTTESSNTGRAVTLRCPACDKPLKVAAELLGRAVKCKCSHTFRTKPADGAASVSAAGTSAAGTSSSPNGTSSPSVGATKSGSLMGSVAVTQRAGNAGASAVGSMTVSRAGPKKTPSAAAVPSPTASGESLGSAFETKPQTSTAAPQPPSSPATSGVDLQPSAMLGPFRVVEIRGRGSSGAIYLAEDTVLERRVALKVLPEKLSARGPAALSEFLRAANISSPLEHPNINTVFQAGRTGAVCFFAVELAERGSAADFANRHGRMTAEDAARFTASAARGLAAAHEAGIVHGHLRPHNLLLGPSRTCRVADFSLRSALERAGFVPDDDPAEFFSPEQCSNQEQDARSDIYSLGACLFFLLTGQPPYQGRNRNAIMVQHQRADLPDPRTLCEDVPDVLADVVLRAMAKVPSRRFASAADMAAELEGLAENLAAAAAKAKSAPKPAGDGELDLALPPELPGASDDDGPRAAPPPPKPLKPLPWAMISAVAAGAVLVVGVTGWMIFGGGSEPDKPTTAPRGQDVADKVGQRLLENQLKDTGVGLPYSGTGPGTSPVVRVGPGIVLPTHKDLDGVLTGPDFVDPLAPPIQPNPSVCLVCRKKTDPAVTWLFRGQRLVFCTSECRDKFRSSPARYQRPTDE